MKKICSGVCSFVCIYTIWCRSGNNPEEGPGTGVTDGVMSAEHWAWGLCKSSKHSWLRSHLFRPIQGSLMINGFVISSLSSNDSICSHSDCAVITQSLRLSAHSLWLPPFIHKGSAGCVWFKYFQNSHQRTRLVRKAPSDKGLFPNKIHFGLKMK